MSIRLYRIPFDSLGEEIPPPGVVGAKAHNLMRIAGRVPVPPAFVIPVDLCRQYKTMNSDALSQLDEQVREELECLGRNTGKEFNSKRKPLLVSVRSGAAVSMPGMMETVLNIGLNEETVRGLIRQTGNPKFAWDCLRRFIQQYGEVVHGLPEQSFERIIETHLQDDHTLNFEELDIEALKKLTADFKAFFILKTGQSFPHSPFEQLKSAIEAVMQSWHGKRAVTYRKIHSIPEDIGTAVIIQAMVFGNTGRRSGSGVGFTRNPANGNKEPYIDYLSNAQGEDVVSGRRNADHTMSLAEKLPEIHAQLLQSFKLLEEEFKDMQDFEFTVEQGKLFLLQSRNGKRTGPAALKIAVDMVEEGIMKPSYASELIEGYDPELFTVASLLPAEGDTPVASALSASGGVAVGVAVYNLHRIDRYNAKNKPVIYLGKTLTPDDIVIMNRVLGIVTILGARTSHAAVVARQLGKVCLVGCESLQISKDMSHCFFGRTRVEEGDWLSLEGNSGQIYLGQLEKISSKPKALLEKAAAWKET